MKYEESGEVRLHGRKVGREPSERGVVMTVTGYQRNGLKVLSTRKGRGGGQEVSHSDKEADEAEKEIQSGYVESEQGDCADD